MAVSIIESPSANAYPPTAAEVFRQQFTQLVQSLQSGDLSGAQQAYASLGQKHNGVNDPYAEVLSQIGQALLSGDLSGAQQALAPLEQQFGSQAHGAHHRHQQSNGAAAVGSTGASGASTNTPSSSTSAGRIVNVTV
jgi:hypothetical protein